MHYSLEHESLTELGVLLSDIGALLACDKCSVSPRSLIW